jgi:hypothetical protein
VIAATVEWCSAQSRIFSLFRKSRRSHSEDQLVVGRLHLGGGRPVQDDVGDLMAQEAVEFLDEVLLCPFGIVLHQDDAMVVRPEDLGDLPAYLQRRGIDGRPPGGIPHPRTEKEDDGHRLA